MLLVSGAIGLFLLCPFLRYPNPRRMVDVPFTVQFYPHEAIVRSERGEDWFAYIWVRQIMVTDRWLCLFIQGWKPLLLDRKKFRIGTDQELLSFLLKQHSAPVKWKHW